MRTSDAEIETERSSRYLVQLCRHAPGMNRMDGHRPIDHGEPITPGAAQIEAEWSETHGVIRLSPWGRCTLAANATTLTLRIEANDEDGVQQIQGIITRDLERFGRRERLTVNWRPPERPEPSPS